MDGISDRPVSIPLGRNVESPMGRSGRGGGGEWKSGVIEWLLYRKKTLSSVACFTGKQKQTPPVYILHIQNSSTSCNCAMNHRRNRCIGCSFFRTKEESDWERRRKKWQIRLGGGRKEKSSFAKAF